MGIPKSEPRPAGGSRPDGGMEAPSSQSPSAARPGQHKPEEPSGLATRAGQTLALAHGVRCEPRPQLSDKSCCHGSISQSNQVDLP
jgi:hypothetical protein